MSSIPTYHDQITTGDVHTHTHTHGVTNTNTTTGHTQDLSRSDPTNIINTTQHETDNISAAPKLNHEYPPTTELRQSHGSLSSTVGPFQVSTTDDVTSKKEEALTSSVGQQSAPGRAGSIGDKALGAIGFGGSTVERPKEDQGLGEKIINFLGA